MGPLNTRNNETFFMDRIWRGRPVLVPGHGGWLRQFGHVEDLAEAMLAMAGNPRAYGQAYNVMGDEVISQVGFVELIAEAMGKPVSLRYVDPARLETGAKPAAVFGQNLVYDCHAVHTVHKLRMELGVRPRYTLASGLCQTWKWYQGSGLLERRIDFTFEDQLLAALGA
jgi:nucleoside-diphosphate-sugar epimerase